jgi:hypothetical protein
VVKYVITSPLSLGRVMWWYAEDALWPAAVELSPAEVADLAARFAQLLDPPERIEILWPGAPASDAHLVLGTIEHFEGRARPAARRHLVDQRIGAPPYQTPPWLGPRLHGRWATG